MDIKEKTQNHENQPDNIIVTKLILSYAQYGLLPIVIPPKLLDYPTHLNRTPSQQGTDLQYILSLARQYDYIFTIEPTQTPGVNEAYWGPLVRIGIPQKALSHNLGSASNISQINIQNDGTQAEFYEGSFQETTSNEEITIKTPASLRMSLSKNPFWKENMDNIRKKILREVSGLNTQQAFSTAQSNSDQSIDIVTVTGQLNSFKYGDILKARGLVGLRGVGYSYDGVYYVKSVSHSIKIGEYTQSFTLKREGTGPILSKLVA